MPSSSPTSVSQANEFCQLLNDCGALNFPISWNSKTKKWNWTKSLPYFLATLLLKGSTILLQILILFWSYEHPGDLKFTQHVCNVLCILLMIGSITVDFIIYKDGSDITLATNWAMQIEHLLISSEHGGCLRFRKISYLFTMINIIGFTVFYIFIGLFATIANLDPIWLAALCFCRKMLKDNLFIGITKVVRLIFLSVVVLFFATNLRTSAITTMTHGFYKNTLIRNMTTWKPTKVSIKYYRECVIVTKYLDNFSYKVSTIICGACFIIICTAVNGAMVGKDSGYPILIAISGGIIAACVITLQLLFLVGGALFINSKDVLWKWKEEASRASGSRAYFKREVKSLPTISMICGDFGIIDQDIKMNYFDNLLAYVVDGMMARNNLLNI